MTTPAPKKKRVRAPVKNVVANNNAMPPIDLTVRFWLDAMPEVLAPGIAPWLLEQILIAAAETVNPDDEEQPKEEE